MSKAVTAAHIKKLHTILGKLEYLQNILPASTRALDEIGRAKNELMRALSELEKQHAKGGRT